MHCIFFNLHASSSNLSPTPTRCLHIKKIPSHFYVLRFLLSITITPQVLCAQQQQAFQKTIQTGKLVSSVLRERKVTVRQSYDRQLTFIPAHGLLMKNDGNEIGRHCPFLLATLPPPSSLGSDRLRFVHWHPS